MEKQFEMRTYGFNELAQLYFPHVTKSSASRMFGNWIHTCPQIVEKLQQTNWKKRAKYFTPKQVKILIEWFDEP